MMPHSLHTRNAPSSATSTDSATLVLRINPRLLLLVLAGLVLLLVILGAVARYILSLPEQPWIGIRVLASRFDLDGEIAVPAWFSSLLLAACSCALVVIAAHHRARRDPIATYWFLLGIVFLYLSVDEACVLHETLNVPLRRWLNLGGPFHFAWVVVALPIVISVVVAYLRFLRSLSFRTMVQFALSGALYVGGALGVEMIGAAIAAQNGHDTVYYFAAVLLEEALEMIGASLFLASLVEYWGGLNRSAGEAALETGATADTAPATQQA